MLTRNVHDRYVSPEQFLAEARLEEGSWWPEWEAWLREHSGNRRGPPELGAPDEGLPPLGKAPGTYVYQT